MALNPLGLSFLPSLTLAVLLALPRPLVAAFLTVTDLGDTGAAGQLRTLITQAAPGDTILIPLGTITLAGPAGEDLNGGGDLDITKSLEIQGAGVTIIDGGGIDRVFDIDPLDQGDISVGISRVTIRNGKPPGLEDVGGGSVQLKNTFVANSPSGGNCAGPITSLGHNLDTTTTCGLTGAGDLSNANPLCLSPAQTCEGPASHAWAMGAGP